MQMKQSITGLVNYAHKSFETYAQHSYQIEQEFHGFFGDYVLGIVQQKIAIFSRQLDTAFIEHDMNSQMHWLSHILAC